MPGPFRRDPWPHDAVIDSVGYGLLRSKGEKGQPSPDLVATKTPGLESIAPITYEYGSLSPLAERPQPYDDFTHGFGLGVQATYTDKKSRYCLGVDTSVMRQVQKGPDIATDVPTTTGEITNFFEIGGNLYALASRYALKRVGDSNWTVSQDFGVGNAATDVSVFFTNAGGGANYAYVGMGDTVFMYRFDGTTWTQHTTLTARYFAIVAREFWRSPSGNLLAKADIDTDPWLAGSWGSTFSFIIGDKSQPITRLAVTADNALLVAKADGLYTLDSEGLDHNLYPFQREIPSIENGRWIEGWGNDLYVSSFRDGFFKLSADWALHEMGPEKQANNNSPVIGRVTAFKGHGVMHAYGGLYNEDTNTSYLMKLGSWVGPDVLQKFGSGTGLFTQGDFDLLPVWHGSISQAFVGKKITAMHRSTIGAPANHLRLYIGFNDGSISYFTLPCTNNPKACSAYRWSTIDGHLYLPYWHGTFTNDNKTLKAASATLSVADGSDYLQLNYNTTPGVGAYTAFGFNFNSSYQRSEFPANTLSPLADFDIVFKNALNTNTPVMLSFAIHFNVKPTLLLQHEFIINASNGQTKRDGSLRRIQAKDIRDNIQAIVANKGSVTCTLPDESQQQLSFIDFSSAEGWDDRVNGWNSGIHVKTIQFKVNTIYGTYARLEFYTYGQLEAYTYGQMENL